MKSVRAIAFAFSVLLTSGPLAFSQDSVQLPAKKDFHLFLLVGQSNMAGRGAVSAEDRVAKSRVLTLNKDKQWEFAVDPIHFDKPVAGVGLGRTFGIVIAETTPGVTVGLIPCAVGGSPISTWQPGAYYEQTKSHPYDDSIERAKAAMQVGTLKGILWHQGESDSNDELANTYEQKLHELIARFRQELDAPGIPFIAGQMGQFSERPWNMAKEQVDRAHQSLPDKVANTAFVSSEGLDHKGDEIHFSAAAYRKLGRRYAKVFREISVGE